MALILVYGPEARPLTLDQVKDHLKVEHDEDDLILDQLIDAAVSHFDGRDGILGRALVEQTWELRLDRFPPCVEIPLPPLVRIEEIAYLDEQGAERTLTEDIDYQVEAGGWGKAMVAPAYNKTWPPTRPVPGAVRIVFTAGYWRPSADSPAEVDPGAVAPDLVTCLKMQVEIFYGKKPDKAELLQRAIDALSAKYRIAGFA
jgi:uncharacterized phiE125 gp8 family phage protein